MPDGKAQITVEYENSKAKRIKAVVVSVQHSWKKPIKELEDEILNDVLPVALSVFSADENTEILINPSGCFNIGGSEADTGLTGRKIMADTYGGLAAHGGGAFSGKDATKVDRSGAYMARYIAKNLVGFSDIPVLEGAHMAIDCNGFCSGQLHVVLDDDTDLLPCPP